MDLAHDGFLDQMAIEQTRKVKAEGANAFEQGRALGALAKDKIHEMHALKVAQYADTPGGTPEPQRPCHSDAASALLSFFVVRAPWDTF